MMPKFKNYIIIIMFLITTIMITTVNVFANNSSTDVSGTAATDAAKKYIITGQGFFTPYEAISSAGCETLMVEQTDEDREKEAKEEISKAESLAENEKQSKVSTSNDSKVTDGIVGMGNSATAVFVDEDITKGSTSSGILGVNCNNFGFMKQFMTVFEPVNITQSSLIMSMVYPFQIIATGIAVVLVTVFALIMVFGQSDKVSIGAFLIRVFVIVFLITYLPYFIQDVLNINNKLVNEISNNVVMSDGANSEIIGAFAYKLAGAIAQAFMMAYTFTGFNPIGLLIAAILLIVVIVTMILKIIFWWYLRLAMIIFYVVTGPIFVVFAMLPNTVGFATQWLKGLMGQIFSQSFVVIAAFVAGGLMEVSTLSKELNLTYFITTLIMPIVALKLIQTSIGMAEQIFGTGLGGITAKEAKQSMESLGDKITGAATALAGKGLEQKVKKDKTQEGVSDGERADKISKMSKTNDLLNNMGLLGNNGGKVASGAISSLKNDFDKLKKENDKNEKMGMEAEKYEATIGDAVDNAMKDSGAENMIGNSDGQMINPETGEGMENTKAEAIQDIDESNKLLDASEKAFNEANEGMKKLAEEAGLSADEIKGMDVNSDLSNKENQDNFDAFMGALINKSGGTLTQEQQKEADKLGKNVQQANEGRVDADRVAKKANEKVQTAKNMAKNAVDSNPRLSSEQKQSAKAQIDKKFDKVSNQLKAVNSQAKAMMGGEAIMPIATGAKAAEIVAKAGANIPSTFRNDSSGAVRNQAYTAKAMKVETSLDAAASSKAVLQDTLKNAYISLGMKEDDAVSKAESKTEEISQGRSFDMESTYNEMAQIAQEEGEMEIADAVESVGAVMETIESGSDKYITSVIEAENDLKDFTSDFSGEVGEIIAESAADELLAESGLKESTLNYKKEVDNNENETPDIEPPMQ